MTGVGPCVLGVLVLVVGQAAEAMRPARWKGSVALGGESRFLGLLPVVVLGSGLVLSACQSTNGGLDSGAFGDTRAGLQSLPEARFYSSDEALAKGKNFFRDGDYGKAEAAYRRAVELMPNDAEAWLGLAAADDRLRRFDLADKGYAQVAQLGWNTTLEYYNNVGYSYLLRGDLLTARRNFLKAYELDPSNEVVAGNLELLRNSVDVPQR